MYRFTECQNPFCPYKNLSTEYPCSCGGSGIVLSGQSRVPEKDPRVSFSAPFRARHRLDAEST